MSVKILVVDDEPDISTMIVQQYENSIGGFEASFIFAFNGQEALHLIEQNPDLDIVLTDINMPVMDGLELLANISKKWPFIKVIVLTAYSDMKNIRKAMNQKAFDFITKPFDFSDLEVSVSNAIKSGKDARLDASKKVTEHAKLVEIEKELETARNIQNSIIPRNFSQMGQKEFDIYGIMKPAKEIGGDFFDYFLLDDINIGLVIADVSGKGVPAAMFMTMTRAALRCFASKGLSDCLKLTNDFLCNRNDSCMFVTLFYGILNTLTGELHYSNAGHNPPYVISVNGALQELGRNQGVPLGIMEGYETHENKITLNEKDCLIYYTDGVTEARNANGEMFTEERLKDFVASHFLQSAKEFISELVDQVEAFTKDAEQSDDITVFCIKSMK